MRFTPFNRNACKSQMYLVKILRIIVLILRKTQAHAVRKHWRKYGIFLENDLELPAAFKGSLREGV